VRARSLRLSCGELEALRNQIAAYPNENSAFESIAVNNETLVACRAGEPFRWRPFVSGGNVDVDVFGMTDATVSGDEVTWTPPHAGLFRTASVVGRTGGSLGWNICSDTI